MYGICECAFVSAGEMFLQGNFENLHQKKKQPLNIYIC